MLSHLSFKKKVVLVIIAVMLFFGTLTAISVFGLVERMISLLAVKYIESVVVQQETAIAAVFAHSKLFVQHIASQPPVIKYLQKQTPDLQSSALVDYFNNLDIDRRYQAIYVMDVTGKTLTSTDPAFVGQNYGFRPYFQKALTGEPVVDAAIGVTSRKFGYYFSYPVKTEDGMIIGVVVAKLKDELIGAALRPKILDADGGVMLADEYGIVIQANRPELVYKSLEPLSAAVREKIVTTKRFGEVIIEPLRYESFKPLQTIERSVAFETFDAQHERKEIIGVARIEGMPFLIVIEEPAQSFPAEAGRIAGVVSIFLVIMTLVAVFILFLLISHLLKPLVMLKNMILRISNGNFKETVEIETGDEFEDLGGAFNVMIAKLNDMYENLENKVWQRTADFEKFRLAVEAASDPVIITDIDGRILYANKAMERLTGYTRTEMIGIKPSLWGRQMPTAFYEDMWNTIKHDKKEFHGELTNKRKSGERYLAEVHISPLLMEKGKLYGFVSIERDITARREADRSKTEFVSIASHQLRTPLAVVNWYVEMLSRGEVGTVNEKQKKYLEQIQLASRRMVDLVNSLLSVSRIDLGIFDVEPEPTILAAVADSTLVDMDQQIKDKNIRIVKMYDPSVPQVNIDPALIRVIFQNLISNAVKYISKNGVVTIAIEKKGATDAMITVTDTGYGIPIGQQSRIFEKFFRADNAREKEPDGNGLGLYIVKSIMDRMRGKIWFESEEGKGTTFYVTIPLSGMSVHKTRQS